jgi:hypothetical protein
VYLDVSENFQLRRSALFKSSPDDNKTENQSKDDRFDRIRESFMSVSTEDSMKTALRETSESF